jgi:hypothetical protein
MKRFLRQWLVLGAVQWVIVTALDLAVFRKLDWRFAPFCEAILLPALASAAVCAVVRPFEMPGSLARVLVALPRGPVAALLAVDALILGAGWLANPRSMFSVTRPAGVPSLWCAGQLAAAAVLTSAAALSPKRPVSARVWLGLTAAFVLPAAAVQVRWWAGSFAEISPFASISFLRGFAASFGGLALTVGIGWKVSTILARVQPLSGALLETAIFFPVAVATIASLNLFLRPRFRAPWGAVSGSLLLIGATFALASFVLLGRGDSAAENAAA